MSLTTKKKRYKLSFVVLKEARKETLKLIDRLSAILSEIHCSDDVCFELLLSYKTMTKIYLEIIENLINQADDINPAFFEEDIYLIMNSIFLQTKECKKKLYDHYNISFEVN